MKLIRTYKYKLRPTAAQINIFERWLGSCRLIYNVLLEYKQLLWKDHEINVTKSDLQKGVKDLAQDYDFIKELHSQVRQNVCHRLYRSFENFFRRLKKGEIGGFPKFAKRGIYSSFTFAQGVKIDTKIISLPKIGRVRLFKDRALPKGAVLKTTTIKKQADGWFACVTFEYEHKNSCSNNQAIGVDMGISYFAVTSAGVYFDNPRHLARYKKRLRILQRKLSRQKKRGRNWWKTKKKIAKLHLKIRNTRTDFLHKISSSLSTNYDLICIEELNLRGMTRSAKGTAEDHGKNVRQKSGLNRSLLDVAIGQFFEYLDYKLAANQGILIRVNPKNTSRKCSKCGHISKNNRKTQSSFSCEVCYHTANADYNASQNILSEGIAISRQRGALARA